MGAEKRKRKKKEKRKEKKGSNAFSTLLPLLSSVSLSRLFLVGLNRWLLGLSGGLSRWLLGSVLAGFQFRY